MPNFGHSKFLPVFLHWIGLNKFRMAIFGHSKFLPVFLYEKCLNKFKMHILAILNLYQSFWENVLGKFRMAIFGHSKLIPVFRENVPKKIQNGHFWPFQFIPVFLGKIVGKNSEWPFLAILHFSVHITLIECNGFESNEICTFLDF